MRHILGRSVAGAGLAPYGLRFAEQHGFVELERYLLREGDTVPWIDLRLI